jgi:hypothetical protein
MKIGTVVRNDYQGIIRYGKVNATFKGDDGWTWCEVDWVDDDKYNRAIDSRNKITSKDHNKTFYRVDELKQINLNKTLQTLLKLQNK